MNCSSCRAELVTGQQFCIQCGASVTALTLPEPPAGPLPAAPPTVPIPLPPPTQAIRPLPAPPAAPDAFAIVEQTGHQPQPDEPTGMFSTGTLSTGTLSTGTLPPGTFAASSGPPTQTMAYPAELAPSAAARRIGRGSIALAVLGVIAGVAAVVGAILTILRVRTDAPIVDVGVYKSNDLYLGTNLLVGLLVGAACLLGGVALALTGRRLGAGLAAGAGISLVPVVVAMWGGTDMISERARANAIEVASNGGGGTFFQTRLEAGFWILVGAAAVGVLVLLVALLLAGSDGTPRLNLAIGVGGALASLAAAAGQMIPGDYTTFADNFNDTIGSRALVSGRLALMAVVAIAGLVGFLRANRWGIGLALGGIAIWAWQWLSSVTDLGQTPLPPGFAPFGSNGELQPHIVTTIGVVAVLVLAVIALLTPSRSRRR